MLDTNTVSYLLRGESRVAERVKRTPVEQTRISAITCAELLYGLARRHGARRLHTLVREFLIRVEVLPWDTAVAERYGAMCASNEQQGISLAPLDLLIAGHAVAVGAILISSDRAFQQVTGLQVENWAV